MSGQIIGPIGVLPSTSAWTPATLGSSLVGWWKADTQVYNSGTTLATNGQTVSQWTDQSSTGANLTPPGVAPTWLSAGLNSKPAVQFNAVANDKIQYFSTGLAISNGTAAYAVFCIGAMQSGADGAFGSFGAIGPSLVDNGGSFDNTSIQPDFASTTLVLRNNATTIVTDSSVSGTSSHRFGFNADGVNTTLYVDGVSQGSGTARTTAQATQGFQVNNQVGNGWVGPLSEMLVVNRSLTSGELTSLDTYLTSRQ